jgi:hypothetical protein
VALEEKQKRDDLEVQVMTLMAKLAAAEEDKAALTKQLDEVQTQHEDLLKSPSIRKTVSMKVRKFSTDVVGMSSGSKLIASAH